jgi:hypothetical protein
MSVRFQPPGHGRGQPDGWIVCSATVCRSALNSQSDTTIITTQPQVIGVLEKSEIIAQALVISKVSIVLTGVAGLRTISHINQIEQTQCYQKRGLQRLPNGNVCARAVMRHFECNYLTNMILVKLTS